VWGLFLDQAIHPAQICGYFGACNGGFQGKPAGSERPSEPGPSPPFGNHPPVFPVGSRV